MFASFIPVFILILFLCGILFWNRSMQAKEIAVEACREWCEKREYQFLDETVALKHFSLSRCPQHLLCIKRQYQFEYCINGIDREKASVTLRNTRVEPIEFPQEDNIIKFE